MKKRFLTLALVLSLLLALVIPASVAMAATDTVTCTVSGKLIALSILDGAVDYGVLAVSTTANTVGTDTQVITNDGTVAETFTVMSSNAAGTTPWTLAATTGTDQYTHESSPDASTWTFMNSSTYVALAASIAAGSTQNLDLRIGMPDGITDYGAHTITVTVLAVEG